MKHTSKTRWLVIALALSLLLATTATASAHPLGNFTISRYSAVTLAPFAAEVLYVVDMAEIPAFQERQAMDVNTDDKVSPDEETAYAAALVPMLASNLHLTVDGKPIALTAERHVLTFPPGQGDLLTLRLEVWLSAAIPAGDVARTIAYEDANFSDRLGWREVILNASDGEVLSSSVPAVDVSNQLRDYPDSLLQAPLSVSKVEARYAPEGSLADEIGAPMTVAVPAIASNRFGQDEFANLLTHALDTPAAVAAALLVAVGLGAAHALTPGHGKTIIGAYLVGSRGTARHALFLGLTTTITHTAGVFVLGLLVLFASKFILPEAIYPWLGVVSGLMVVGIGLTILRGHLRHWRAHRRGAAHDHGRYHFHLGKEHSHGPHPHHHVATSDPLGLPDPARTTNTLAFAGVAGGVGAALAPVHGQEHEPGHDDGHNHSHGHEHGHSHDHFPSGSNSAGLSWRNLLALGVSGGLLPCPSALILMLSAIALQQVGTGLVLILAFSVGLAGVLAGIGIIMVYAGRILERVPIGHSVVTTRLLPMASATFITVAGLLITFRALSEAGIP